MLKTFFIATVLCAMGSLHAQEGNASRYLAEKEEADRRFEAFASSHAFAPFQAGKTDAALQDEFDRLSDVRRQIWTTAEYKRAEHLIASNLIRAEGCVAFAYNNTVPYFNASTVYLGGKYYIACEGPRAKDVSAFFTMLAHEGVTHLVRLTGAYEGWAKKCHPYWEDCIVESGGASFLHVPEKQGSHAVRVFHMDHWRDHQGIDPEDLLTMALQVKGALKMDGSLLVVHCSAGVGRTGTFLAALAIVDAIDQGACLSIEEIVYRLSLQRIHSVARAGQYITLHRLAEIYLRKSQLPVEQ